jgi:hypothetical protein
MGVSAPDGFEQVRLTDSFPVVQPSYVLNDLLATAAQINPNLLAAEASSEATIQPERGQERAPYPFGRRIQPGTPREYTDENLPRPGIQQRFGDRGQLPSRMTYSA